MHSSNYIQYISGQRGQSCFLPDDSQALKRMLRALMRERDKEKRRADKHVQFAKEQSNRANSLYVENLRLQLELDRYRKWYYGPRADRLQSFAELAQLLLNFAEEMDLKPVNPEDLPPRTEPKEELRRVGQRKGRRNLANFENLPITTQVHELSGAERACPCCGKGKPPTLACGSMSATMTIRTTCSISR
jgi:hypothetical protein